MPSTLDGCLDGDSGGSQPPRRPATENVLLGARPLVRPGVELLRAEVRPAGNERLEERRIGFGGREYLQRERAVEVQQMVPRRRVELERPGDLVEAGRAGQGARPSRESSHA